MALWAVNAVYEHLRSIVSSVLPFFRVSLTWAFDSLVPAHLILLVPNYLSTADDLLMNGKDSTRPLWIALNTGSEPFALLNGLSKYCEAVFVAQTLSVSRCSCGSIVKPSEWVTQSCNTVDICLCSPLAILLLLWALAPRVCVCLSLQIMSLIFSLSFLQSLSQFEGIWLALLPAPFFSKTEISSIPHLSSFTTTLLLHTNRFSCQASNHPVLSLTAQLFRCRFLCKWCAI